MFNLELEIKELSKRTTRIESRLVKLATGAGVDVKTAAGITITHDTCGEGHATIDTLDTQLSTIINHCQKEGVRDEWVSVRCRQQWIAQVFVP